MTARRFTRAARVRSESFDAAENTVDLVWTTGAVVRRTDDYGEDYDEALSMEPGAVRLDRLNSGAAPFLAAHDSGSLANVIGSVVPGSASIDEGQGQATVKLSRAPADRDVVSKIRDGVIRSVSVGYLVHDAIETEEEGRMVRTATDWGPLGCRPSRSRPTPARRSARTRSASTCSAKLRPMSSSRSE